MPNDQDQTRRKISKTLNTMTKENILETHESGTVPPLSESTGSASVGRGQRLAPAIWNQFKNEEMRFVDMLELVAVLLVNVADKTQSTDYEIAHMTRKLVADMRHRASLPNAQDQTRTAAKNQNQ